MADLSSDRHAPRPERDSWQHDNERGLSLAADGEWADAAEAFAAAADGLARVLPSETRSVHEPLALILSNLAQAHFRQGRLDEAILQAQRVCALRVAIAGEDGMPVARARMDLAVMLASVGRLDEATALIQRAIAGVEHRVGEEDARLVIVLENAARIALAAGHPANAEPLLLRLHALLDAHELSTARADALLARVAAVRARQITPTAVAEPQRPATPVVAVFEDDMADRVYAHASIAVQEEWDDQPLRDAVAVTDVLLRTTPSGVPIIPVAPTVEPPSLQLTADNAELTESLLDTMDLSDVLPAPSLREPDADSLLSLELADEAPAPRPATRMAPPPTPVTDDTDFELDLAFDDLAPLSAAEAAPVPSESPAPVADSTPRAGEPMPRLLLDFAVEHGMASDDDQVLQGPPISTPVPGALDEPSAASPAAPVIPVTQIVSAGPTAGIAPLPDIVQTAPPAARADLPPTAPPSGTISEASRRGEITREPLRSTRRTAEERVVLPPAPPAKGKGGLVAAIVGAVVVLGGAAAFFLLR